MEDNEWIPMIYDFLSRDLKVSYNWWLCDSQRKKFIRENKCTNKGIYFTLKYFYEIKGNSVVLIAGNESVKAFKIKGDVLVAEKFINLYDNVEVFLKQK